MTGRRTISPAIGSAHERLRSSVAWRGKEKGRHQVCASTAQISFMYEKFLTTARAEVRGRRAGECDERRLFLRRTLRAPAAPTSRKFVRQDESRPSISDSAQHAQRCPELADCLGRCTLDQHRVVFHHCSKRIMAAASELSSRGELRSRGPGGCDGIHELGACNDGQRRLWRVGAIACPLAFCSAEPSFLREREACRQHAEQMFLSKFHNFCSAQVTSAVF